MLKIYGTSRSRATRALWCAEELGLRYEHVPTAVADCKNPEFLKVNPNGHIPVIDDDGLVLCESMAINLYLAEKYGRAPFWPADAGDKGRVFQWSFWSMLECEGPLITVMSNRFQPENQRDEKAMTTSLTALRAPLKVMNEALASRPCLLGSEFTLADLNVASVLVLGPMIQLDMSAAPNVAAWLDKCLARPAMQKARALP